MEDVIFNGTRNRAPMGMAEVTITLTQTGNGNGVGNGNGNGNGAGNGNGHNGSNGHAASGDVVIQRRLYRSGESIYLIDGKPCRLRDIQDIFLGTGLGPQQLRHHRTRPRRPIAEREADGSPRLDRRGGRDYEIQGKAKTGRIPTRSRQAESFSRERHSR